MARTGVPGGREDRPLKLHADQPQSLNTVTAYGPGYIEINAIRHERSLLVMPEGTVEPWPVERFEDLAPEHFEALLEKGPEVVLLGTGARLRFPHPRLTAALSRRRIGVDAMDMQAACRTYNILMAEGRKVAAILLLDAAAAS
ncbi:Xcc1710-like domain-containing protein [Cupriavidus sp. H19C3]